MVLCRPFLSSRPTHPPLISLCKSWAALEPWGLLRKRGLELPAPIAGQGLDPSCCRGCTPIAPLLFSVSLHLASSAGSRPMMASGSQACMPVRALCPPAPWSLRFVLWAAVLGQSGMPVRGGGRRLRPPPPLLSRDGPVFGWAAERRRPLKLPGQGPSALIGFPTFVLPQD